MRLTFNFIYFLQIHTFPSSLSNSWLLFPLMVILCIYFDTSVCIFLNITSLFHLMKHLCMFSEMMFGTAVLFCWNGYPTSQLFSVILISFARFENSWFFPDLVSHIPWFHHCFAHVWVIMLWKIDEHSFWYSRYSKRYNFTAEFLILGL